MTEQFTMLTIEKVSLMLIIPANVLYTLAAVTHAWFELPGVFYGLWWAEFCDILSCQIIPAFFTEEPAWYHLLQITSLVGWIGMFFSLFMLISHKKDFHFKYFHKVRRQQAISAICIISVFMLSTSLIMFYAKLNEDSNKGSPRIHWSAFVAGIACLFELVAGLLLLGQS